ANPPNDHSSASSYSTGRVSTRRKFTPVFSTPAPAIPSSHAVLFTLRTVTCKPVADVANSVTHRTVRIDRVDLPCIFIYHDVRVINCPPTYFTWLFSVN